MRVQEEEKKEGKKKKKKKREGKSLQDQVSKQVLSIVWTLELMRNTGLPHDVDIRS